MRPLRSVLQQQRRDQVARHGEEHVDHELSAEVGERVVHPQHGEHEDAAEAVEVRDVPEPRDVGVKRCRRPSHGGATTVRGQGDRDRHFRFGHVFVPISFTSWVRSDCRRATEGAAQIRVFAPRPVVDEPIDRRVGPCIDRVD